MKINTFELERYFAKYEFSAEYLLSSSDCEPFSMNELVNSVEGDICDLWNNLTLGYTEANGHPLLLEEIARLYTGIEKKNVQVAVPQEGIFLVMHALLKPGDHVICTYPGYQSLYEVGRSIGCRVDTWEPEESKGWYFKIDRLKKLLKPNTKLVVINFPHNPTGAHLASDEFGEICRLVQSSGTYLLSDEMYRWLELNNHLSLPSACEIYEKAISLCGLSKSFGMPGLRIGWIATKDEAALEKIRILKDYTTICASAPSEILAVMALQQKASIIKGQSERLRRNLRILEGFMARNDHAFTWHPPLGGSICFPRYNLGEGAQAYCNRLIADTGIMLVPATKFQFGDSHVRIGFGRENFPFVIQRLSAYLKGEFNEK